MTSGSGSLAEVCWNVGFKYSVILGYCFFFCLAVSVHSLWLRELINMKKGGIEFSCPLTFSSMLLE